MQILSLRLKNIKSHRDAEFLFSPGINVLAGPNGAGKSTLFEAIGYALFGVDARDIVGRADRFISLGAKRGEVEVVFRGRDEGIWRITRTVGPNARWLLAAERGDGFEVEEHAGAEETEERLRQLLGLDRGRSLAEHFRQVIGPLQSEFLGPFVLRGAKRQEAFDRILGIDGWRRTFEGTLALQKAVQNRIACLEAEIAGRAEQLAVLPARNEELKAVCRQEKEGKKKLRAGEKELEEAQRDLDARERHRLELEKAEEEYRRLGDRIVAGGEKTGMQRERVAEAEQARLEVEAARSGREAFERAEKALKELRGRERERQAAEKAVHLQERECDRRRQQLEHEAGEIAAAERQLEEEARQLTARLSALCPDPALLRKAETLAAARQALDLRRDERALLQGKFDSLQEGSRQLADGVCPFLGENCGNLAAAETPLAERLLAFEAAMTVLQGQIGELEREVAGAETAARAVATLKAQQEEVARQQTQLGERRQSIRERAGLLAARGPERERAEAELASRKEALALFAGIGEAIAAAEQECERNRLARDRYQAAVGIAGDLEARRQTLLQYETLLAELQAAREAKGALLIEQRAAYDPRAHAEAAGRRDRLMEGVAALRQEAKGTAERRARLETEIDNLRRIEAEIRARKADVERLREKEGLVRFLRTQIFNQVSARLSERFREEISRRADRLYRIIAETDEELLWGEGYQVALRDLVEGEVRERSDEQLSGGQAMSAVVALRLALLQTTGARLAFFDEPTSNLDADRRENLARAFRAIDIGREEATGHWYDQLFLISHDTAFAEITDQVTELPG